MQLSQAAALVAKLEFVESTGSTNDDLVRHAASPDWPDVSVLAAAEQTAGKGRAGRVWESRPEASLSVSILVRPNHVDLGHYGWLPILAGLAMTEAVAEFLPDREVGFKWPNDVLVGERKISGVLSELTGDGSAVVIGAGLNLTQTQAELPIENATSLALQDATVSFEAALETYLANFVKHYRAWLNAKGDADLSGLRREATLRCSSIGRRVRAIMPGDNVVEGKAIEIDEQGRLLIAVDAEARLYAVAAGDIVHLRHN